MSFSFNIPTGPAAEFGDRAAAAKVAIEAASENNDYALTRIASTTADAAIKAATDLVAALGDGTASGSINGHHSTDGVTASTAGVSVSVTPAPKTG